MFVQILSKKREITPWGGGTGSDDLGQKSVNLRLLWRSTQESSNPNLSNFFNKTTRCFANFEDLSSAIDLSSGHLWLAEFGQIL